MRISVRLFGALAERAGRDHEELELAGDVTAGEILRAVGDRHPGAAGILDRVSVAVNREVAPLERAVGEGDEVALLPPVAGGAAVLVGLRARPSTDEALAAVGDPGAGGTAVFLGTVRRDSSVGPLERLEYSAYEEMAVQVLGDIAEEIAGKWPLLGVAILHGVGHLGVGEPTVVVACSAPHRAEAFEACRYAIDEVKRRTPIWKKEVGAGGQRWVGLEP
ncbi:MAG TPA: molybdenum cofactor biosynthesis protein MoaE [Actinomycetota bacterium]|nr:molybdenum cofactor biosynthesis protein MoaE [Actinomycetota bacterium]